MPTRATLFPVKLSLAGSGGQAARGKTNPSTCAPRENSRRLYLSVRSKFLVAFAIATLWTALSTWLSGGWLRDLAAVTNWPFALIAIGFIAYVPGFMNAFLIATLLLDRKPPLRPVALARAF